MNIRLVSDLHPVFLAHRDRQARFTYPTVGPAATQEQLTVSGRQVRAVGRRKWTLQRDTLP